MLNVRVWRSLEFHFESKSAFLPVPFSSVNAVPCDCAALKILMEMLFWLAHSVLFVVCLQASWEP